MKSEERRRLFTEVFALLNAEQDLRPQLLLLNANGIHDADWTSPRSDYSYWKKPNTRTEKLLVRSLNGGQQLDLFWFMVMKKRQPNFGVNIDILSWCRAVRHPDGYLYDEVVSSYDSRVNLDLLMDGEVDEFPIIFLKVEPSLNEVDSRIEALNWLGRALSHPETFQNTDLLCED